jgi:hypothetical protein
MLIMVLARKPPEGTVAFNAVNYGTGGINIDECRIAGPAWKWGTQTDIRGGGYGTKRPSEGDVLARNVESNPAGRWPSNVIFQHFPDCRMTLKNLWGCQSGCPVDELNRQSGHSQSSGGRIGNKDGGLIYGNGKGLIGKFSSGNPGFGDTGGASRYFKQVKGCLC